MSKQEAQNKDETENMAVNSPENGAPNGESTAEALENAQNNEAKKAENDAPDGEEQAAEAASAEFTPAELTPEEQIAELEKQLAEKHDQLLRKTADFENFRKRMNQEKQNAIEYANQSLLLDIIPVIDDLERAIQAGESASDNKTLLEGVKMIEKRLTAQLESKWGLKRFISAGEPFDPNRHEALMVEKSPDVEEPIVAEDLIKGYMLKDRVIRAAKVKVKAKSEE